MDRSIEMFKIVWRPRLELKKKKKNSFYSKTSVQLNNNNEIGIFVPELISINNIKSNVGEPHVYELVFFFFFSLTDVIILVINKE